MTIAFYADRWSIEVAGEVAHECDADAVLAALATGQVVLALPSWQVRHGERVRAAWERAHRAPPRP